MPIGDTPAPLEWISRSQSRYKELAPRRLVFFGRLSAPQVMLEGWPLDW